MIQTTRNTNNHHIGSAPSALCFDPGLVVQRTHVRIGGAQGLLGTEAVARAKPDGYTIALNPVASTMAASVHLFKKLSFDPLKDIDLVGMTISTSFVLIVTPSSGIQSVADLTQRLAQAGLI